MYDSELFGICKALEFTLDEVEKKPFKETIIFTDNSGAIQRIKDVRPTTGQELTLKIWKDLQTLKRKQVEVSFKWVPGHQDILGNEEADKAAKEGAKDYHTCAEAFTSLSFLKRRIKEEALKEWTTDWDLGKKGTTYGKLKETPGWKAKTFKEGEGRTLNSTLTQLRVGHGYFKSYLKRLPNYDSDLCIFPCRSKQTPEHLLLVCEKYKMERRKLQRKLREKGLPLTLDACLRTAIGLEEVRCFLKETKIARRTWLLRIQGEEDDDEEEGRARRIGWGAVEGEEDEEGSGREANLEG